MRRDGKHADWQIDRSIELYHASRQLIALTDQLVEASGEAIRESTALLERTAQKADAVDEALWLIATARP